MPKLLFNFPEKKLGKYNIQCVLKVFQRFEKSQLSTLLYDLVVSIGTIFEIFNKKNCYSYFMVFNVSAIYPSYVNDSGFYNFSHFF